MILDTELLISIDNDEPAAADLAVELEAAGVPMRIPTAVVFELYISVGFGGTPNSNARANEALVANKPTVALDANVARRAGTLEGQHRASSSKPVLGPVDAIVAATGLTLNEPVVTNDGDFETVDGLAVELY